MSILRSVSLASATLLSLTSVAACGSSASPGASGDDTGTSEETRADSSGGDTARDAPTDLGAESTAESGTDVLHDTNVLDDAYAPSDASPDVAPDTRDALDASDAATSDADTADSMDAAATDTGLVDAGDETGDGAVPPLVDDAPPPADSAFFDATGSCSTTERTTRWKAMVSGAITLPNHAATLDLAGADGYGLTLGEAEMKLCQGASLGDQFGNGTLVSSWGDSSEVWMDYYVGDRRARWLNLWAGYLGTLTATSADSHTYVTGVGTQVVKDGAPLTLTWTDHAAFDEVWRALMTTYAPTVALPAPGVDCVLAKRCVIGSFGVVGYFYAKELGFALWVDDTTAAQPVPSIPTRLDVDLLRAP